MARLECNSAISCDPPVFFPQVLKFVIHRGDLLKRVDPTRGLELFEDALLPEVVGVASFRQIEYLPEFGFQDAEAALYGAFFAPRDAGADRTVTAGREHVALGSA